MFLFFVVAYMIWQVVYIICLVCDIGNGKGHYSSHDYNRPGDIGFEWTGDDHSADIKDISNNMNHIARGTHDDFGKWIRSF